MLIVVDLITESDELLHKLISRLQQQHVTRSKVKGQKVKGHALVSPVLADRTETDGF